jgi:hypothetical protein
MKAAKLLATFHEVSAKEGHENMGKNRKLQTIQKIK